MLMLSLIAGFSYEESPFLRTRRQQNFKCGLLMNANQGFEKELLYFITIMVIVNNVFDTLESCCHNFSIIAKFYGQIVKLFN